MNMLALLSYVLPFWSVAMAMLSNQDLIQACKSDDVQATQRLLQSLDPSADNNQAIIEASCEGHSEVVRILLADPRVVPNTFQNEAIRCACHEGHSETVKLLLADPRVDPSALENEAIKMASCQGHTKVVELLLADPRVDPTMHDNNALRLACLDGRTDVVKLFLADPRVDPSDFKNAAILYASQEGHVKVVELLLADPRVNPSANNNEAIRCAGDRGHTHVVKLLLAHPKVLPDIELVQKTFGNSNVKVEFFQEAKNQAGLDGLMPLASIVDGLTLEVIDILISRAKGIQMNQQFLHSLRLSKLPIQAEVKIVYGHHLQALFSVVSSSDVMKLVEVAVFFAEMGIDANLFRLIVQYL